MNFETANKPSDITLEGIKVEFEHHDKTLKVATLTDQKGNVLRLVAGAYDGLKLFVPAKPKMENRYVLVGKTPVAAVREVFASRHEATRRKEEIEGVFRSTEDVTLEIKAADVPINDDGEPVVDDIPF